MAHWVQHPIECFDEEYGPKIIYIKGELNTVADAISRLEFSPKKNPTLKKAKQNWMIPFCRTRK